MCNSNNNADTNYLILSGCTFNSNQSLAAGALYWIGTELTLTSCTFSSNTVTGSAAAVKYYTRLASKLTVTSSTFTGNDA